MYVRRHSRIHEQVLLSNIFQLLTGVVLIIIITVIPRWGLEFWKHIDTNSTNALIGVLISFSIAVTSLRKLFKYPGAQSSAYILPSVAIVYSLMMAIYLLIRLDYSIQGMILGAIVTLVWCYVGYFLGHRYRKQRFALIPFGEALDFPNLHGTEFVFLQKPDLEKQRFDGVVADLRSENLTPDWEKFLARCTLSRIPVYHTKQIIESLTGRVKINHLSENELGTLLPSIFYERIKRFVDFLAAAVLIPFLTPILLITSILIRMESRGPAFFLQKRMGFRGRPFTVIKFRTMSQNIKGKGFTEGENDPRITKLGKYLRKYRIDELPQIFNVLKGDMSFIGPRPESMELSEWYEKDVPFFAYRHVVRPGISGWAQVEQGYAAEVDGMNVKLEYDFYYIKNFSFWLDMLVTFKTVKTILTGFGAR
ncbi:exopolysaccharide biosynthesis polyprenyl glycosylphosphotransferase [Leptospira borgpetersenii]|uniref:Bacterial sugar transferase domain-containing protein n=3 Tax=Leptospira borgpetersenii TaxID=174 RepID=Q9ZGL1_LEPBO|nr:exopolysaccharide biosynthesis polyprenyl glycosylphosphotransferase [Leptospira borgpetersenii]AAD12958.1 unknown [Leptospira borgpetersenii]ABJ75777.1 Undecaprenyl-galactosyl transferase [Leptospira borgpetersenii serovar Hardjo-bovis str. JB197]ABJ78722.1 Undecaprenyl-galactosyl transferase [Leptospira borgpetersenii serovar Hardjo-bovis str. L550]AMX59082.1 glycosyl transferase [Leptospira borgpetersenii serovar Hardjo]AMX61241.1 glycosyl transferase [Leptospira borgpetersenii serovar H